MRPCVDDELVEELSDKTNSEFRVPADRLGFNDRLRALFDRMDRLEQENENLRERLRSDQRVIQSNTASDATDDDRRGDSASSFL
jgi:regulator of replication initiation timing